MGIFDKIKFWKKEEELGNITPQSDSQSFDPLRSDPYASQDSLSQYPEPSRFQQYPQTTPFPGSARVPEQQVQTQPMQESIHPRDVELILAKLDAIKSEMDALHQRVRKIEQATETQKKYW